MMRDFGGHLIAKQVMQGRKLYDTPFDLIDYQKAERDVFFMKEASVGKSEVLPQVVNSFRHLSASLLLAEMYGRNPAKLRAFPPSREG